MSAIHFRKHAIMLIISCAAAVLIAGCGSQSPNVGSVSPNPGATDVPLTPAVVQITFDQAMDKQSVENAVTINPAVPGTPTYSWSNSDKTVSVNYPGPFAPGTTYQVTVGKSAQSTGNAALKEDYQTQFTTVQQTAPPPSTTAPGATGAPPAGGTTVAPAPTTPPSGTKTTPGKSGTTGTTTPGKGTTGAAKPSGGTSTAPGNETGRGPAQPAATGVTFAKDIKPLAATRCKTCHQAQMADYNNITSKKLVVPGNSAKSPYYLKPSGKASHPGGNVWKDKADLVKNWIDAGAPK